MTITTMTTADQNEHFAQMLRPNPVETDYAVRQIEGEVPRELAGTLYRNGPNQKITPKAGPRAMHFFEGDALVHALHFEDRSVRYRGRYARTESFLESEARGAYCHGGLNLPPDAPLETPMPNHQPNTNIVAHAGRLFAMAENMPPFEMDPTTLESKGLWTYDGRMRGISTTAHPKIDGRTGQMWIHGYQPIAPFISLYCVEPDGRVSLAESHDAPWASMMHDFAITENYVIFPLGSIDFDLAPMLEGKRFSSVITGTDRPMQFGIRSRAPGSEVRWIEAPSPGYMFHPGNAYEEDGKIVMDACTYPSPQGLIDGLDAGRSGSGLGGVLSHPYQYEIDLAAGTCKETRFSESAAEFPRLDDRLVGYKNRWGYAATADPADGAAGLWRRITKYDREGGPSVHRPQVDGQWVGEPVFVPRSPNAEEDDGFVLNLIHDGPRDQTALEILDARAIEAEPIARLWLDERIPVGFHGNWAAASD